MAVAGAYAVAPMASPVPDTPAPGGPPAGCSPDYSGSFTIQNTMLPGSSSKRTPPQEGPASPLGLTLEGGILRDSQQRFGYIAANHQFQFDNPIQAGSIYTTGWSACSNNTLALGGSTTFYQCKSGNFYNLYNTPAGVGCIPIEFAIIATSSTGSVPAVSSTVPVYSASSAPATPVSTTPVAVSTTPAPTPVSSAAPTSVYTPPPTVASAAPTTSYTGAAQPLALEGSFFAVAAGAVALAMF